MMYTERTHFAYGIGRSWFVQTRRRSLAAKSALRRLEPRGIPAFSPRLAVAYWRTIHQIATYFIQQTPERHTFGGCPSSGFRRRFSESRGYCCLPFQIPGYFVQAGFFLSHFRIQLCSIFFIPEVRAHFCSSFICRFRRIFSEMPLPSHPHGRRGCRPGSGRSAPGCPPPMLMTHLEEFAGGRVCKKIGACNRSPGRNRTLRQGHRLGWSRLRAREVAQGEALVGEGRRGHCLCLRRSRPIVTERRGCLHPNAMGPDDGFGFPRHAGWGSGKPCLLVPGMKKPKPRASSHTSKLSSDRKMSFTSPPCARRVVRKWHSGGR